MGCEGSGGADETEEVCASVEALRELEGLARQQEEAGLMVRAGEGGIYAAMWKLLKARRLGAEYSQRAIPILQQTIEICETWSLDPYRLDSAGAGVWLMSGGALGLAVANKVYLLEHAYYTVISPEGCASILWRDATKANVAAEALKITAPDLMKFEIIDGAIKEPLGGAHHDYKAMADELKKTILSSLEELSKMSGDELKKSRYEKFRKMGAFLE